VKDSIAIYLEDIGKTPLLTAADERELSRKIEAGREAAARKASGETGRDIDKAIVAGSNAKERFIKSNLRLVVSIAKRYPLPHGIELLDLIQEGNLGLEHAVDKFDWTRGFKFSTYATFWIRQAIGRGLDQKASLIRIPSDLSSSLRAEIRRADGDADSLEGRSAELLRLSSPTSLNKVLGTDGDTELGDLIAAETISPIDAVIASEERRHLYSLLENLEPRARYAVEARFGMIDGEQKSFREIGEELNVTAEAARRTVQRAIDSLKEEAVFSSPEETTLSIVAV
jgi:RNA polymerase primary sigma factor